MEQKTKRNLLYFGLTVVALTGLGLAWKAWGPSSVKSEDDQKKEDEKRNRESANDNNGGSDSTSTPPAPLPPTDRTFPLNSGDRGDNVKALQTGLIKMGASIPAGATGYFGTQTIAALKSKGYSDSVSKTDFEAILDGKKKVATSSNPPAPSSIKKTVDDMVGSTIIAPYDDTPVYYAKDTSVFKKYKKGIKIGTLGSEKPIVGYHKLFHVSGDNALNGVMISDQIVKLALKLN
jgi:hypothetical protein